MIPEELRRELADSIREHLTPLTGMCQMQDILLIKPIFRVWYIPLLLPTEGTVLEIRIDQILRDEGRTFYWLAKSTGISHTTLWRLKKGKALGINFDTLEKVCRALNCQPGDVLFLAKEKSQRATKPSRRVPRKSTRTPTTRERTT
jgi:putative transcriptional regulator